MKLGLLSTANINRMIIGAARSSPRVDVVAVASRDANRARAYASEHSISRSHGSYDELLADGDVDAVYVSLPNALHHEWTMRAMAAGKHVLCEKPYSRRPEEVEEAFDAAEQRGLVLMEAFMYRHHPQIRQVTELVASEAIGGLQLVRAAFSFPLAGDTNIRARPELDGGVLMDVGCYCISGARLFGGRPESVIGLQLLGATGVDMTFHGLLRFPGEIVGQFDCSFRLVHRQSLEAIGDEGSLLVEAPWRADWGGGLVVKRGDETDRLEIPPADPYRLELENLADAIAGVAPPLLGREDALDQARTIDALYRSASEGRSVGLD